MQDSRLSKYKGFLPALPEDREQCPAFIAKLAAGTEEVSVKLCQLLTESPHQAVAKKLCEQIGGGGAHVQKRSSL